MRSFDENGPWSRWLHTPQRTLLRRIVFQVHFWTALMLGLYILFISVTGSVLVFRDELYLFFAPQSESGVVTVNQGGVRFVSWLMSVHEDFTLGRAGRQVNGIVALFVLLVIFTGLTLWWPGVKRFRRSMTLRREIGWRRLVWDLHGFVGFWSFGFLFIVTLSGIYLCFPQIFHGLADTLQPSTELTAGQRFVDDLLYWLAFLHFGRIDGIGIICEGPGFCDMAVKATWAFLGLAPAVLYLSGLTMWWNRVLRKRLKHISRTFHNNKRNDRCH